jgi:DnaJ-class molecular chaperone
MTLKDYYRALDMDRDASQEEIKRAFRMLALQRESDHGSEPYP